MWENWKYVDEFKTKCLKSKSENTVEAYLSDLRLFAGCVNKHPETLTVQDIENYKKHLFDNGINAKTINRKLLSIRKYTEFLRIKGFKTDIEINLIKIQKQEFLENLLESVDFERLVRAAEKQKDKRALALFYTLYTTGARISEALQIRVRDIENNFVQVIGKGSKVRSLFFQEKLRNYLRDYIRERKHDEDSKLFLNKTTNTPMSRQSADKLIKFYAGNARVNLKKAHAHNFRHLYGITYNQKGVPIDQLAQLLGHSDINTTKIYTQIPKEKLFKIINNDS